MNRETILLQNETELKYGGRTEREREAGKGCKATKMYRKQGPNLVRKVISMYCKHGLLKQVEKEVTRKASRNLKSK